jgi:threonine aldolase
VFNRRLCAVTLTLALSACASDPAPTEQLRLSDQALSQAKALGAGSEQLVSLKLAEEKQAQAQLAMQAGNFKQARVLAEQAELDARLAQAQWLTQKSQEQLDALARRIDRLRKQLGDQP